MKLTKEQKLARKKEEKQRLAIAEYCGTDLYVNDKIYWMSIPDYPNDLNAMHEAEKKLLGEGDDWGVYCDTLMDVVVKSGGYHAAELYIHTTAAQRAEAFLKTIGKWEE
jgi:hypothetical protein